MRNARPAKFIDPLSFDMRKNKAQKTKQHNIISQSERLAHNQRDVYEKMLKVGMSPEDKPKAIHVASFDVENRQTMKQSHKNDFNLETKTKRTVLV